MPIVRQLTQSRAEQRACARVSGNPTSRYEAVWVARLLARKLAAVRGSVNPEERDPFPAPSLRGSVCLRSNLNVVDDPGGVILQPGLDCLQWILLLEFLERGRQDRRSSDRPVPIRSYDMDEAFFGK